MLKYNNNYCTICGIFIERDYSHSKTPRHKHLLIERFRRLNELSPKHKT